MKRYYPRGGSKTADMSTAMNGEWVKHVDHVEAMKKLEEERDALHLRIAEHETNLKRQGGYIMSMEQQIIELTAERDEMAKVLDDTESSYGLSSNGNMWRFWSEKALESARINTELRAELAEKVK